MHLVDTQPDQMQNPGHSLTLMMYIVGKLVPKKNQGSHEELQALNNSVAKLIMQVTRTLFAY